MRVFYFLCLLLLLPSLGLASSSLALPEADSPDETTVVDEPAAPPESLFSPAPTPKLEVSQKKRILTSILYCIANLVLLLNFIYAIRHYAFTLNRLFAKQRHPYLDIETADWPDVAVFVPAHNEEAVIADCLASLLQIDYPQEKLLIVPMNDRSTDGTKEIIDDFARRYPQRIQPLHRSDGKPGKSAALKEAMELFSFGEIALVFDADYIPPRGLLKMLLAPFFDPEVGAVMGRVVPVNVKRTLITRLLDLERSAGYQVDQQARMNLRLVPQYGGTVGGIRRAALEQVGGWREDALAEDTDITYRLLMMGWKTVYENRAECYEEVPETWPVRIRQIKRWAMGHNEAMFRYSGQLIFNKHTRFFERIDGLLLLGVYAYAPLLILGWVAGVGLFFLGQMPLLLFGALSVVSFGTLGNFAPFYEIAAAVRLDGLYYRSRLLPFTLLGFFVSQYAILLAVFTQVFRRRNKPVKWQKTERFRKAA